MMMPANYSVIAENELSYVEGGASFIDWVGDRTATVWTAANVKTFNTNLLTILSNTFTADLVKATMGTMFSGTWGDDDSANKKVLFGDDGTVSALYKNGTDDMTFGNKVMKTLGLAASVYTLGTTPVKNVISEKMIKVDGTFVA